jgi:hypothetical protein
VEYERSYSTREVGLCLYFIRLLPDGTFIRLRGERDDIPDGSPQYDTDGNEIDTDEEFD